MTRGVHGWRGDWLVNGDGNGIVELRIEPPARAAIGGIPIRLRPPDHAPGRSPGAYALEDPEGFLAAITAGSRS